MKCYEKDSLYHAFSHVIKLHFYLCHKKFEKLGVYPGQPPVLFILDKEDGISQKELANIMRIKPATLTVMLGRMEKVDLIRREQDENDQRISRVYVTEKGTDVLNELKSSLEDINEICFRNFTAEEKIILRRLMLQVKENLEESLEEKQ